MQHRFDVSLLLDQLTSHLGAHPGAGARSVGNIDAIDPGGLAQLRAFDFLRCIDAARRQNLDERNKSFGGELRAERALFLERNLFERLGPRRRRLADDGVRTLDVLQTARFFSNFFDVIGSGAAASAHDAHAGQQKASGILRHVLGRAQVEIAALHRRGQSRVGHRAERLLGIGDHLFDGFEHHLGARRTIQADNVHRPFVQLQREIEGRGTIAQGAVVFDAQLHHHHHLGTGRFARGKDRFADFVDVAKRFEHQEVDAGLHQRVDLLAKNRAGFLETGRTERFQANSQRSDGSGDKGLLASGFTGDTDAGMIDQTDFF